MASPTDAKLVRQTLKGDHDSYKELVVRYQGDFQLFPGTDNQRLNCCVIARNDENTTLLSCAKAS